MDKWLISYNIENSYNCNFIGTNEITNERCGYIPCHNDGNKTKFCSEETCPLKIKEKGDE